MTIKTLIGIDPGWKNLGYAMINYDTEKETFSLVHSQVFNPSGYKNIVEFIKALDLVQKSKLVEGSEIVQLTMERFIAYKGVDSAEFEIINRLIGALTYYYSDLIPETFPRLERAIDWKMDLVKVLHMKKGFNNPSDKLDKKFSIAAATACLDGPVVKIKTDHECDAICLAALPIYVKKVK
jgi:hypothetical protein